MLSSPVYSRSAVKTPLFFRGARRGAKGVPVVITEVRASRLLNERDLAAKNPVSL